MNFPNLTQRYKGTLLPGQEALGSDPAITGTISDIGPGVSTAVAKLPINSVNGWPTGFVLLAYNGPDATYQVRVYVWEGTVKAWQMISGGDVTITKGIVAAIPVFSGFGSTTNTGNMQVYVRYTGSAAAASAGEHNVSVSAGA